MGDVGRARAWVERLTLAAALAAGVSFLFAGNLEIDPGLGIVWKGAGVGLLAGWAAQRAEDADGWLLALVMLFGAIGDVLLETSGLIVGAVAFLVGHLLAIRLYLKNRRAFGRPELLVAAVFVIVTVGAAMALTPDPPMRAGVALYTTGLATMAACAWLSRFPIWTALGALMFVVSDLLIFARAGVLEGQAWPSLAIWILYFGGQALIAVSVGLALARRSQGSS
jgi:uncharacterized membrane protein YhhN